MSHVHWHQLARALADGPAVLVTVEAVQGSGPREVGAWMAVLPDAVINTIGGGQLEFQAIDEARAMLAEGVAAEPVKRYPLGPILGQCCGGVVHLRYQCVQASDIAVLQERLFGAHAPVALFGGGHVGKALIHVLGTLPLSVTWVDSRDEIFPAVLPLNVQCEHSDPVHAAVADLRPGTQVLIMSFSHAEDLDVVAACLQRQRRLGDLPYIGLIGSKTKWATFRHRLAARGFNEAEMAWVTSPIGLPDIGGKEPEVIAVSVAAQLLQAIRSGKP